MKLKRWDCCGGIFSTVSGFLCRDSFRTDLIVFHVPAFGNIQQILTTKYSSCCFLWLLINMTFPLFQWVKYHDVWLMWRYSAGSVRIRNDCVQFSLALLWLSLLTASARPNAFFHWPLCLFKQWVNPVITLSNWMISSLSVRDEKITLLAVTQPALQHTHKESYTQASIGFLSITTHQNVPPFESTCLVFSVPKITKDYGKWQMGF